MVYTCISIWLFERMPFTAVSGSKSACVRRASCFCNQERKNLTKRTAVCVCLQIYCFAVELCIFWHFRNRGELLFVSIIVHRIRSRYSILIPVNMAKLLNRRQPPKLQKKLEHISGLTQDLPKFFMLGDK